VAFTGIPEKVQSVVPMPPANAMERIIGSLETD
jgi:hypothetical protein